MELKQTAAIVTGGGLGMGAETAKLLAAQGVRVSIFDTNFVAAQQVAHDIKGFAVECDVRSASSVEAAVASAQKQYGAARICVNCAGIAPGKRMVGREGAMPLNDFRDVIDINLIGTFNVMRVVAAAMSKLEPQAISDERGVIINTASVAAYEGQLGQTAYSASKGGVVAMTLPAARELAQFGIRVMAIAPGIMATPMMDGMSRQVQDTLAEAVTFPKRLGHPDEYASLVLHILQNGYLNGEVIRLDGGLRMQAK